jgi:hypothetical protein
MKVTEDFGVEADQFKEKEFIDYCRKLSTLNKDKFTEGVFAPWCMYKADYLAIGGHDELFAPQSKEDSDLFNRFVLNGYKVIQSWDGLVYHFTSRGSRFNKHAGGGAGKNSEEWLYTTNKNARNFIRKWGHFVKHDAFMKPIIPHKYNVGFVVHNCNLEVMSILEPWCDTLYTDDEMCVIESHYLDLEQKHTKIDLKNKLKIIKHTTPDNDIVIEFDAKQLDQEAFKVITQLSEIITQSGEVGEFELGIFKISIYAMTTYEHQLIKNNI